MKMHINSPIMFISTVPIPSSITDYSNKLYLSNLKKDQYSTFTLFFEKRPFLDSITPFYFLFFLFKYKNIHIQYTPTLVGPFFLVFLFFAKISGKNIVVTSHEKPDFYLKKIPSLFHVFFLLFDKLVYKLSSKVIVHTREHYNYLDSGNFLNRSKVSVIPHPIFELSLSQKSKNEIYSNYKLIKSKLYLICFGRIVSKKNYERVFQLLSTLPRKYEVLIIGEGDKNYVNKLKNLAIGLNISQRVHFLGFKSQEELADLFKISEFALFLYKSVTQSGALATAIAHNLPVICTDLDPFRELFEKYNIGFIGDDLLQYKNFILTSDSTILIDNLIHLKEDYSSKFLFNKIQRLYQE